MAEISSKESKKEKDIVLTEKKDKKKKMKSKNKAQGILELQKLVLKAEQRTRDGRKMEREAQI